MIDIHTHILPGIDDGSSSVEETVSMLNAMAETGVRKVIATPHFYPEVMTLDEFLTKRQESYNSVKDKIPQGMEVRLGAEVMLAYDLYKEDLRKLAIDGTDYILIEMPYGRWDPWVFDELFKIISKHTLDIIIAHVDRYVGIVGKDKLKMLFNMKLKYQANVDYLGGFFKKSDSMKFMKDGLIDFIGTDCHNMDTRVPCMGNAAKIIKSRLGKDVFSEYMESAEELFR